METSKTKKKKWRRFLGNKYALILLVFAVWMLFFDTNSLLVHKELNDEIKELDNNKVYFQQEIEGDKEFLEKLKDSSELEKFARETYFLKKENEEIFIIEHEDSIQKK
ncbi:MAG: septum formation initiator [Bacteroidetes bacterium HGW-Bacteroidetes-2]|jgi:cell division protein FtsB|nr:MAG: septum formation initiator [Bacteroidetes bacterium HGW-Bacteroidetes-8]PKP26766.1 MAG: septum formation initiator [Bacteroidetes bacterium HGW-Bacteroidetes-2]